MIEYLIKDTTLTDIANAIRGKTGKSTAITPIEMATEIDNIETGVELPTLTNEGTASDLFSGKQLIDGDGNKVIGTFSIESELNTQDDLIAQIQAAVDSLPEAGGGSSEPALQNKTVTPSTSSQIVTADSGYDGLDTVTVNAIPSTYIKPTSTKTATTYTPTTTNQTIAAGTYCSGVQTIEGDSNLVAGNIKSGVSIFGVSGSYEGSSSGSGGSIETCNLIISGNFEFIYNSISNGSIIGSSVTNPQNHSIVVPCSSLVTVYDHQTMYGITEPTQMNNMTIIYDGVPYSGLISVFQVPSIANSECSLMF